MIAVVRVRFDTNTNPASVWDDATLHNWLNPAIPYSLAHYWAQASWGHFDMTYFLFAPIIGFQDPRPPNEQGAITGGLVGAVLQALTEREATAWMAQTQTPLWDSFKQVLVLFAQPVGGGYTYAPIGMPNGERINVVAGSVDSNARLDDCCHEIGHVFGLDHELGLNGEEYGDWYSIMSCENEAAFQRPPDSRLPSGPQLTAGALLCAAQLRRYAWFNTSPRVTEVSASYLTNPRTVTLHALDDAAGPGGPKPALATIPPAVPGGVTYGIELRRPAGYDHGLGTAAVVIHSFENGGRVRFRGEIKLDQQHGDRDWHSWSGHFIVRVDSVAPDFSSVSLTIEAEDYWNRWGLDLTPEDKVVTEVVKVHNTIEIHNNCMDRKYNYEETKHWIQFTVIATSFGYERPVYTWWVNGVLAPPPAPNFNVVTFPAAVTVLVAGPPGQPPVAQTKLIPVSLAYDLKDNVLTINSGRHMVNFDCTVEVMVSEGSSEVISTGLPAMKSSIILPFHCQTFDWEPMYYADLAKCHVMVSKLRFHPRMPILIHKGDPPPYFVRPQDLQAILEHEQMLNDLRRDKDERADPLLEYMVLRYTVPRDLIVSRLQGVVPNLSVKSFPLRSQSLTSTVETGKGRLDP